MQDNLIVWVGSGKRYHKQKWIDQPRNWGIGINRLGTKCGFDSAIWNMSTHELKRTLNLRPCKRCYAQ